MEMPGLTAAHRKLERMVGRWIGEETLHPSPWDAKGGTATGKVTNARALEGFAVVQDYAQERGGAVTYRGHGVLRFDPPTGEYVFHWFDSIGSPPNEFRGTFDGDVLALQQRSPRGISRAVWTLVGADRYDYRMDVSPDGTAWACFMEGVYRREG